MGGKEGQRLEHWKQFGRNLVLVIVVQVEGGEEVPFRAELGHRQETASPTIWKKQVVKLFDATPLFKSL